MYDDKIIINFCPTGMVPDKNMNPNVPVTVSEIVEQTHQAYETGITIVHLHARRKDGQPTYKSTVYRDIFEGVKKHCPDLVICGSTSGRKVKEFEKRSEVIELKPDMCSLTLSSLNFPKSASLNEPDMIIKLAEKMEEYGVHPELECFGLGMINYGNYLITKSVLKKPFYWNLIFGNISGFQAVPDQIGVALNAIPDGHYVAMGGIGDSQITANASAIAHGFGVRVGLEDNLWMDKKRSRHASNQMLLERIHQLLLYNDREYLPSKTFGGYGFFNSKSEKSTKA